MSSQRNNSSPTTTTRKSIPNSTVYRKRASTQQQSPAHKKSETHKPAEFIPIPRCVEDAIPTLKYKLDSTRLNPLRTNIANHFVELDADEPTRIFLYNCFSKFFGCSPSAIYLATMRYALSFFMSHTDILGFLNCGLMHVVSRAQVQTLLTAARKNKPLQIKSSFGNSSTKVAWNASKNNTTATAESSKKKTQKKTPNPRNKKSMSKTIDTDEVEEIDDENDSDNEGEDSDEKKSVDDEKNTSFGDANEATNLLDSTPSLSKEKFGSFLDIGAGSGRVTELIKSLFTTVSCTEVSKQMVDTLRSRKFEVFETADINTIPNHRKFDTIALFNVLDRCMNPIDLLADIKKRLSSTSSFLILAVPLPLRPAVEVGKKWIRPTQAIAPPGCYCQITFEEGLQMLIEDVIDKAGYEVRAISRVPYLSEGDRRRSFYVLDDCLLVLSPKSTSTSTSKSSPTSRSKSVSISKSVSTSGSKSPTSDANTQQEEDEQDDDENESDNNDDNDNDDDDDDDQNNNQA